MAMTREKKVKGRKRQLLVDTLGNLLRASVHAAAIHDATGGEFPLADLGDLAERLAHIWVDAGYRGLVAWAKEDYGLELEVVTKEPGQQGFAVQKRRWVVERTIAWFCRNRRLSKDYEYHTECSEAFLYCASIHLLIKRLAKASGIT